MAATSSYTSLMVLLRQANAKAKKKLGKGDLEGVRLHAEELRAARDEHYDGNIAGTVVSLSLARMKGVVDEKAEEADLYAKAAGVFMARERERFAQGLATLDQDVAKALIAAGYAIQRYAELREFVLAYCLSMGMAEGLEVLKCLDLAAVYYSMAADAIGCSTAGLALCAEDSGKDDRQAGYDGLAGAGGADSFNISFSAMSQYFSPHRHFPGGSRAKHVSPSLMQSAALYRAFVCFVYVWDPDAAVDRAAQLLPPEDSLPAPPPSARQPPAQDKQPASGSASVASSRAVSPRHSPRPSHASDDLHLRSPQKDLPGSSEPLPAGTLLDMECEDGGVDHGDDDDGDDFWCAAPAVDFYAAAQQRVSPSEELLVSLVLIHLAQLDFEAAYASLRRLDATRSTRYSVFLHVLAEEVERRETAAANAAMLLIAPTEQMAPPFTLPLHLFLYSKVALSKLHPVLAL